MRTSIIVVLISSAIATSFLFWKPVKGRTEAQRVAEVNHKYYSEVFDRCSQIRPLAQFIQIFEPSEALEFFDNETMQEVMSVVAVAHLKDGYQASFVAPVTLLETGKYHLNGTPTFLIEDLRGGVFTKHYPGGSSSGPAIRLGPSLWQRFVSEGARLQSLREVTVHSRDA